jgi:hypothetical protein
MRSTISLLALTVAPLAGASKWSNTKTVLAFGDSYTSSAGTMGFPGYALSSSTYSRVRYTYDRAQFFWGQTQLGCDNGAGRERGNYSKRSEYVVARYSRVWLMLSCFRQALGVLIGQVKQLNDCDQVDSINP